MTPSLFRRDVKNCLRHISVKYDVIIMKLTILTCYSNDIVKFCEICLSKSEIKEITLFSTLQLHMTSLTVVGKIWSKKIE